MASLLKLADNASNLLLADNASRLLLAGGTAGPGGFKDWTAEQVKSDDFDAFLQRQVRMVFASAAARDAALNGYLKPGLHTFQKDTNQQTTYNGTTWVVDSAVPAVASDYAVFFGG